MGTIVPHHMCVCIYLGLTTQQATLLFNCHIGSWDPTHVLEDSSDTFELVDFFKARNMSNNTIYHILTWFRHWVECFSSIILFNPAGKVLNIMCIFEKMRK